MTTNPCWNRNFVGIWVHPTAKFFCWILYLHDPNIHKLGLRLNWSFISGMVYWLFFLNKINFTNLMVSMSLDVQKSNCINNIDIAYKWYFYENLNNIRNWISMLPSISTNNINQNKINQLLTAVCKWNSHLWVIIENPLGSYLHNAVPIIKGKKNFFFIQ